MGVGEAKGTSVMHVVYAICRVATVRKVQARESRSCMYEGTNISIAIVGASSSFVRSFVVTDTIF